ncbi:MAG TPA: energy transducer TonB [Polyangium sp.]|nr:energy transducer TonB [Polyangium sp.]
MAITNHGGIVGGASDDRDPLAPIFALGNRAAKTGAIIGLFIALSTHGYASGRAMTALFDMQKAIREIRSGLHDFFWTEYDVEVPPEQKVEEKKEEPPPPEPEPEPAPKMDKPAPKEEDPYEDKTPPPPPAQAAKVLTAKEDPDEPVDMTGNGFVTGDGTGPGYGMVSAEGTGKTPTFNKGASLDGKEGGTGTGKPPPPPPTVDLSKPPSLVGSTSWDCPFPPEADAEQIDQAVASVVVTVRPDGSVQSVKVVEDPGYGFGRAARICALARKFSPGLDKSGQPATMATPPIRVRFTR